MDNRTRALMMGAAGAGEKIYVEDVFSTYLYTGNSSTQTITNDIDLSGKGGLVWCKARSAAYQHELVDTARGGGKKLVSSSTNAESVSTDITGFTSSGFTLGNISGEVNFTGATNVSWTFRKQAKFFDVVTWTGNDVENRAVAHSLGSTPGCIIVKQTSASGQNWHVWHRSINPVWTGGTTAGNTTGGNATGVIYLNSTAAFNSSPGVFTYVNSTAFGVYYSNLELNSSGSTYVAYLFAHDAGGFGDSGNDSIVKCGSFTTDGSGNATVDLGWEPQFLIVKSSSTTSNWNVLDIMRGMDNATNARLLANLNNAETSVLYAKPTATGFTYNEASSQTYIYIAIRRGPMKTPTDATKVLDIEQGVVGNGYAGTPELQGLSIGFPSDMTIGIRKNNSTGVIGGGFLTNSRLTSGTVLYPRLTDAESSASGGFAHFGSAQADIAVGDMGGINDSGFRGFYYNFRRAPGFFDVVCYTGNSSTTPKSHGLGVEPELIIIKNRSNAFGWAVYSQAIGNTKYLVLNGTDAATVDASVWNNTSPTSTTFTCETSSNVNANTHTYIAYLFASCPGVSKCGSYTGTGTTQQIDCGFTSGARFVLIKRTDSTGDWYVWDTTRGIVAGDDPYLLLNSSANEVTNTDYIDTYSAGFEISSTAPAAINSNGGSFIFLAIA